MRGSAKHPPAPPRPPPGPGNLPGGATGARQPQGKCRVLVLPGAPVTSTGKPSRGTGSTGSSLAAGDAPQMPRVWLLGTRGGAGLAGCLQGRQRCAALPAHPAPCQLSPVPLSRSLQCVPPRCSLEPLVQGKLMVGCGQGGTEFIEATRSSCAVRDGAGGSGTSVNPLRPLVPLHPRPQAPPGSCCVTEGCDAGAWQVALPPEPGLLPARGSSALPFVAAVVNFSGNIGLSP